MFSPLVQGAKVLEPKFETQAMISSRKASDGWCPEGYGKPAMVTKECTPMGGPSSLTQFETGPTLVSLPRGCTAGCAAAKVKLCFGLGTHPGSAGLSFGAGRLKERE